jgi:hypothetical protein
VDSLALVLTLVAVILLARAVLAAWPAIQPPTGELESLEQFARAHKGVLEIQRRYVIGRTLDGARLACKVGDRRAWVEIRGNGPFRVEASVEIDRALELEIARPTFYRRVGGGVWARPAEGEAAADQPDIRFDVRRARDETGDAREKLFVHAGDALTAPLSRLLYDTGVDLVRASRGQLGVTFDVRANVSDHANAALVLLEEIARAYSRRPAPPAVGALVERFLWLEGSAPRCPYCHVDIAENEGGLAACERCRTIHHAACFAEHGGCTLLGCGGRTPLPAGA